MDRMNSSTCDGRVRISDRARFGQEGFTVVELIAVVIVLSILGAFAMGRMGSPAMFAPAVVTHALVAETRFAQQLATSRHDAVVTLMVDQAGSDWRFRVSTDVDGVVRTELVDTDGTTVQASSGPASGSLGGGSLLALSFDHGGDLSAVVIGATSGDPAAGVSLMVTGDSTRQACVYASGYANDEACS